MKRRIISIVVNGDNHYEVSLKFKPKFTGTLIGFLLNRTYSYGHYRSVNPMSSKRWMQVTKHNSLVEVPEKLQEDLNQIVKLHKIPYYT